jgi:formylglycine-generating enzyme required for sulfatase activity/outer membrane protein OmpA-like peptidoglycan-associated protein
VLNPFGGRSVRAVLVSLVFSACAASSSAAGPYEARVPGERFRDCADCPELVVVPPGEFDMGSNAKPAEQPVHRVAIGKTFALGSREVTLAEWDKCVAAGGCKPLASDRDRRGEARPATNLSWDDAKEFTAWLSKTTGKAYRLPTEAEWEYAARGGSTKRYWWGDDVGVGNAQCADCGNAGSGGTAPSGSFRPNAFGLYDVAGNAAEWVEDCWNPSYRGAPTDGAAWTSGNCSLRVLRGGSFADGAVAVRSSARFRYDEDVRYYANGFRVARDVIAFDRPAVNSPSQAPAPPSAAGAAPPTPMPFEEALSKAANDLFAKASLEDASAKVTLIIDPLIDGATGARSNATLFLQNSIVRLVKEKYPRFEIAPFSAVSIAKSPVVLIGTFTAINNAGVATGPRDAYRICLALADLGARKIISKSAARALPEGVDPTPTPFFAESPAFAKDAATEVYVKSCQTTKPGDPIAPGYADRILVASLINQAIQAYETKHYGDALDLYRTARQNSGGEQLRVLNGIYLANEALHRRKEAADAFDKLVEFGLKTEKLAVAFLFQTGSTIFVAEPRIRSRYETWLTTIANRTNSAAACLEIVGHTSATGASALNDELSVLRAQYIKDRLESANGALRERMIATGKGSRELIVGTGRNDLSDALDRRVEFNVIKCAG